MFAQESHCCQPSDVSQRGKQSVAVDLSKTLSCVDTRGIWKEDVSVRWHHLNTQDCGDAVGRGSSGGSGLLSGDTGNVWRHLGLVPQGWGVCDREVYTAGLSVARGQGPCWTSCRAQASPATGSYPAPKVSSAEAEKPCVRAETRRFSSQDRCAHKEFVWILKHSHLASWDVALESCSCLALWASTSNLTCPTWGTSWAGTGDVARVNLQRWWPPACEQIHAWWPRGRTGTGAFLPVISWFQKLLSRGSHAFCLLSDHGTHFFSQLSWIVTKSSCIFTIQWGRCDSDYCLHFTDEKPRRS